MPARLLAPKPANLSYGQAAAVPMAAATALVALRDAGRAEPGHKVLVNGASGGVGTFAVQIARALGASTDAVCGAHNAELVSSLGADDVIGYAGKDFTRGGRRYDVLLDVAGRSTVFACGRVLALRERWCSSAGLPGDGCSPPGTCSPRSRWRRWCRGG